MSYSVIIRGRGGGVDHPQLGHGPAEVGPRPEDEGLSLRETRRADLHVHQRVGEQERGGPGCNIDHTDCTELFIKSITKYLINCFLSDGQKHQKLFALSLTEYCLQAI